MPKYQIELLLVFWKLINLCPMEHRLIKAAGDMVSIDAFKDSDGLGGNINNIGATISGDNLVYLTAASEVNNAAAITYKIRHC